MALRIPLGREDMSLGFSRLLVLGVKSTLAPDQASDKLAALFDSHHYTRGLAIVPQGTPTNNTAGSPTSFPPDDPFGQSSFVFERTPQPPFHRSRSFHCTTDDGDIDPLAESLGMPNGVFQNVL